jgi:hypothetical protein
MKILSLPLVLGCCFATASAQTPALVRGHKVLLDKNGQIVQPMARSGLPTAPLVGGADSCVTPDVITGTGSFAYDNTVASTGAEGQAEGLCLAYGTTGLTNDVWFTWVAPFTGNCAMTTCGVGVDSKIAAYAGTTCPVSGSALACNDDSCGLQSVINFNVTSGSSYVLQVGNFPGAGGTAGNFTLNQVVPPMVPPNDDCSTPIVLPGPGTYAYDTTLATTSAQQSGTCPNAYKDIWYRYDATTNGSATVTTCGLVTGTYTDTVLAVYNGSACPSSGSIACNDDSCGLQSNVTWTTVCGQTYMIQVGQFGTTGNVVASINVTETGTSCGPTGVPFCFGDGSGTACPCGNSGAAGNGCASSVNANGANLTTTGSASLANDTLVLHGTGMPNSNCLYFQGTSQISVVFGDGLRCAGGTIVRLGTKTNAAGASQFPSGADPSVHVKGAVSIPGSVRTYQTWYRNAAAFCSPSTFNLTNGVLVTWQ